MIAAIILLLCAQCVSGMIHATVDINLNVRYYNSLNDVPRGQDDIVVASFNNTVLSNGWSTMEVSPVHPITVDDKTLAYAAGYIEGYLSSELIAQYMINAWQNESEVDAAYGSPSIVNYTTINYNWVKSQIQEDGGQTPYWYHIGLLFDQLEGMYAGYLKTAPSYAWTEWMLFYGLQMVDVDFADLCSAYDDCGDDASEYGSTKTHSKHRSQYGHCSAVVKWTEDLSDIYVAHTTWSNLYYMLRMYKKYDLPFRMSKGSEERVPASALSMSSYPGTLFSLDDFYQMDSNILVTETSLNCDNNTLWELYIRPEGTVFDWMRNMVANRLAHDGLSWCQTYEKHNSGTYNNQFMILDYNKFTPGSPTLQDGTLFILEQMPGNIQFGDATYHLNLEKYWASFNIPWFPHIFQVSNQTSGDVDNYNKTSRGVLMRELQGSIVDDESMGRFIRHNKFQTDAVGTQGCTEGSRSGGNAIAERADLTPSDADCVSWLETSDQVGIDAKFARSGLMKGISSMAQSGPTYDDQPVFQWSTSDYDDQVHIGMPDSFDFPWVKMVWQHDNHRGAVTFKESDESYRVQE